jgi:hypothetical protein
MATCSIVLSLSNVTHDTADTLNWTNQSASYQYVKKLITTCKQRIDLTVPGTCTTYEKGRAFLLSYRLLSRILLHKVERRDLGKSSDEHD